MPRKRSPLCACPCMGLPAGTDADDWELVHLRTVWHYSVIQSAEAEPCSEFMCHSYPGFVGLGGRDNNYPFTISHRLACEFKASATNPPLIGDSTGDKIITFGDGGSGDWRTIGINASRSGASNAPPDCHIAATPNPETCEDLTVENQLVRMWRRMHLGKNQYCGGDDHRGCGWEAWIGSWTVPNNPTSCEWSGIFPGHRGTPFFETFSDPTDFFCQDGDIEIRHCDPIPLDCCPMDECPGEWDPDPPSVCMPHQCERRDLFPDEGWPSRRVHVRQWLRSLPHPWQRGRIFLDTGPWRVCKNNAARDKTCGGERLRYTQEWCIRMREGDA